MIVCPKCKSAHVTKIIYGYPTSEDMERAEMGEIILGGCLIMPNQPDYGCLDCGQEWSHQTMDATDITKIRFKIWENGPGFIDSMKKWTYEIYPGGKTIKYTYIGRERKYFEREEEYVSENKQMNLYQAIQKTIKALPEDIRECQVCDGCSYQLQITYCDRRKKIIDGDLGGGTVDDIMMEFLHDIYSDEY